MNAWDATSGRRQHAGAVPMTVAVNSVAGAWPAELDWTWSAMRDANVDPCQASSDVTAASARCFT